MSIGASSKLERIACLRDRGFVVVPALAGPEDLRKLNHAAREQLAARREPLEYEADVNYPGSPSSRASAGGDTVRRLLDAYARDQEFARWGTAPELRDWMEAYFGEPAVMSRVHHNCLMTKHPLFGSLTDWHRDIRFWSFEREDLVSFWLALGNEDVNNGALWFVPGSHRRVLEAERFDETRFFRADRADNAEMLSTAESPRLEPGDAVFFHCNTLHSAGRNQSDAVKFSLVYTYHARSNPARACTRSDSKPEVELR